jgi:TonB-linked SusC/RagA family outer membrane protein
MTALLSAMLVLPMSAQDRTVKGRVMDDSGSPLPGASIWVKETSLGTTSNINGEYVIHPVNVKDPVLTVSFVGYTTVEEVVGDRTVIDFVLNESTAELEEVVVVGYGVQKKTTMIGSVAQAKGEDLLKTGAVTNVSQAIQGLMPGVVAISSTSKPGDDAAKLIIRGKGTWHNTDPLCLVDGVERDFNDVDPNEIESISVLKDAAATAVYGVKGGNGVIIITTKRGLNQRPSISISANFGFKQPTMKPEYADYVTSMKMWNEAVANDGAWNMLIPESTIAAWENAFATGNYGPDNDYFPEVDWWKEMIKPLGFSQQYNLNVRGGSNFVKYFVSFAFLNEGDIYRTEKNEIFDPTHNFKRYNWRTNLDFNLTTSTVLSVNLAGKQGNRNQPGYRLDGSYEASFFRELYNDPRHLFPVRYSDGEYGAAIDGMSNLRESFDHGQRMFKSYQNFVDLGLKQNLNFITQGLSAQAKFSFTTANESQSRIQKAKGSNFGAGSFGEANIRYYRKYDYTQPLPDGGYELIENIRFPTNPANWQGERPEVSYDNITGGGYERRIKYEASVNYARTFGKHAVTALGVFDRNQIDKLLDGATVNMKYQEREEAWVTRVTYGYAERYLLELNGAYTGSMRFARDRRFKFFPSYSVAWRISEESFIKNSVVSQALSNLKIRYSYGTVGFDRNADFFEYVQKYKLASTSPNLQLGSTTANSYGPIIVEDGTANVNATWETAYKQNLGVDFGLFDNRLTGNADFFKENRKGIIMSQITPAWFGFKDPQANLGETKTHGLEIELGWNAQTSDDFRYWIKVNFSTNENRVVERNDPFMMEEYLRKAGKPIDYQTRLGVAGYYGSLDDIYNYASAVEQTTLLPGDFMYIDYNADGTIIYDDLNDRMPMEKQNYPRTTYGWSMGFSWKNFDFSMMWYGVLGVYKNVADELLWDLRFGQVENYFANPDVLNRWTPETALTASKPTLHALTASSQYNQRGTTYNYRNASYLRLKNMEVAYTFNQRLIGKVGMSKCQIYVNANNLLTFTNFNKYIDPESNSASLYPLVRRYNIGLRIGF